MILYFSGTGNSKYVAQRIAKGIDDECLNLFEKLKIKDHSHLTSEKPWVLVTPTYAWQIPNIVKEWLNQTVLGGNKDIYFVLTCGDSIGNASTFAKKYCQINEKNFKGLAKVVMPENYIAMFSAPREAEAKAIIDKSEPTIDAVIEAIKNGKKLETTNSFMGAILSGPINSGFYKFSVKSKDFTVSDDCTGCGICERNCVTNNIKIVNGKPEWNDGCTHCMSCICFCPTEAIEYGTKSIGQPRYKCPK